MKKFISIPNVFKGVGDAQENLIFPAIIDRNASGFVTCYKKGDILFKRLAEELDRFKVQNMCWVWIFFVFWMFINVFQVILI